MLCLRYLYKGEAMKIIKTAVLVALGAWLIHSARAESDTYQSNILQWRAKVEAELREPYGWLSQTYLGDLPQGNSLVGSSRDALIRLSNSAPAKVGLLELVDEDLFFTPQKGSSVLLNGVEIHERTGMIWKEGRQQSILQIGAIRLMALESSFESGVRIRVRDPEAPTRKKFKGNEWFPISEKWKARGIVTRYRQSKDIEVKNSQGGRNPMTLLGEVAFQVQGQSYKLLISGADEKDGSLFIIFKDRSSDKTTYPPGRFIWTTSPDRDGFVELDFNKAFQPPCAFVHTATCPFPPKENNLPITIEAGERWKKESP